MLEQGVAGQAREAVAPPVSRTFSTVEFEGAGERTHALVHRNLDAIAESKRVEIGIVEDKLVVTSPGGLRGVSERQLGRPGGKSAVSPVLYDMCKNLRTSGARLIEGEGGGIREVLQTTSPRTPGPVTPCCLRGAPHTLEVAVTITPRRYCGRAPLRRSPCPSR